MVDKKQIAIVVGILLLGYLFIDEDLGVNISEVNIPSDNGKTIFIISGVSGTPVPYQDFSDHFSEIGYGIRIPILKGHGGKLSDFKDITFEEFEEDLIPKINEINGEVILMGTSAGSLLALDLSNKLDKRAIIINFPLETPTFWKYLTFFPYMYRFDYGLVKDSSALDKVPRYHKYPTSLLVRDAEFARSLDLTEENPILIIQSLNDIRAHGSDKLNELHKNSEIFYLDNSGHLPFIDVQKELMFDRVDEFLSS